MLRVSYARTLETPFNENLVLSSEGCANDVLAPLLNCTPGVSSLLPPGYRNEFHAGLQQAFGSHLVVSGEYIWKYTHNAFDFSVLGNTPITFPIDWHNSKIPGYALHIDVPEFHNFSAYIVMSSVAARFFPPQSAGAGATVGAERTTLPHRPRRKVQPDHAPAIHTAPAKARASGLASTGATTRARSPAPHPATTRSRTTPTAACGETSTTLGGQPAVDLSGLTADQQFQAGLTATACAPLPATSALRLPRLAIQLHLINIPAPGTGNDDHNPPRIAPRNLFDVSLGKKTCSTRPLQNRPRPDRDQRHQQVRAL